MTSRLTRSDHGRSHRYALVGKHVKGATTILNAGVPKPALVTWAAKTAAQYAATHVDLLPTLGEDAWISQVAGAHRAASKEAMLAGTVLHAHAHALIGGDDIEVTPDQLAMVQHVADFLERWQVKEVASERPCANLTHEYAGTFDLIADLADGRRWLLDYKTGRGVYPDVALQLAAYRFCDFYNDTAGNEVPMPPVDECGVVHVTPAGWELLPVQAGDLAFSVFQRAIGVAWWQDQTGGWPTPALEVVGAPVPKPEGAAA